ncbi:hypothetical protein ACFYVL_21185 [Streptomyces sp. NPDC004111]|uniref:hypothetical protein n=1 Tax=Streptomyces sp. NPDC004111 TaxID=3364690 RepID=UPI0036B34B18
MHRDTSWDPSPVRGTVQLTAQFLLTVVYAPFHWALCLVLVLGIVVVGMFLEIISWIPGVETGFMKLIDAVFTVVPMWPLWFVTLPELRHEGDEEFYRERVERQLTRHLRAKAPQRTLHVGRRKYRALGAGYVVEAAGRHGWELSPGARSDPWREVELVRPPALDGAAPSAAGAAPSGSR